MNLNKDLIVGVVVGAAIAGGSNHKAERQEKKRVAAEAAHEARLERANHIKSMVITEPNPLVVWGSRLVYAIGLLGLGVVAIHIFH
jgi:hypothetical protein